MQSRVLSEEPTGGTQLAAEADKRAKQIMDMARILPVFCNEYTWTLSDCHKPHPRIPAATRATIGRAVTLVGLQFAFALAATAADPAAPGIAGAAGGAAGAAVTCARAATQRQHLNLSSGVYTERAVASAPLSIELPTGLDQAKYGDCLRRAGFDEHAATAAYLERADACRETHTPRVRLARDGEHARLAGGLDEARYRACLAGEIAVEVTLPE